MQYLYILIFNKNELVVSVQKTMKILALFFIFCWRYFEILKIS